MSHAAADIRYAVDALQQTLMAVGLRLDAITVGSDASEAEASRRFMHYALNDMARLITFDDPPPQHVTYLGVVSIHFAGAKTK